MADFDDDGDMDLLYGDDVGNVRLYLRDDEGDLSFEGNIEADDEEIDVNNRAAPELVDWDLDGDYDLLVGSDEGVIVLFMNEGSNQEYDLTDSGTIESDGTEIWLGTETVATVGDLDDDGKRDLIVGSVYGEIWFYPNIGEDDELRFGEGVKLSDEEGEISVGYAGYTRPELVDWEGDGDLDLVTGIADPEVRLYINPTNEGVSSGTIRAPMKFKIEANYPEPFNYSTSLVFEFPRVENASLDICSISGRLMKTVCLGTVAPGRHTLSLDLSGYSCGKYVIIMHTTNHSATRIVTFLK